jgi:signal transduction histidine kinase
VRERKAMGTMSSLTMRVLENRCARGQTFFRLQRVAREFNMRLEERVSERTRIARDLHDTLLQSFQGVLLCFQAVSNLFPTRPQEAKERLDDAFEQAAQAITEGRDAVQGLRSSTTETNDLAEELRALGEGLAANQTSHNSPVFDVGVEGAPQKLAPDPARRSVLDCWRGATQCIPARPCEPDRSGDPL